MAHGRAWIAAAWFWWLAMIGLLAASGCALKQPFNITITPICADGLPVKLLIDQACPPDGVCGYTCAPNRWEPAPAARG